MKPFAQDNQEAVQGASSITQEEAISALQQLPEHDQIKVLEYIQELVNFSKDENH
jgi:uncharacterized protein (UPF0147 family)